MSADRTGYNCHYFCPEREKESAFLSSALSLSPPEVGGKGRENRSHEKEGSEERERGRLSCIFPPPPNFNALSMLQCRREKCILTTVLLTCPSEKKKEMEATFVKYVHLQVVSGSSPGQSSTNLLKQAKLEQMKPYNFSRRGGAVKGFQLPV